MTHLLGSTPETLTNMGRLVLDVPDADARTTWQVQTTQASRVPYFEARGARVLAVPSRLSLAPPDALAGLLAAYPVQTAPQPGDGYAARMERDAERDPGELYSVEQAAKVLERTPGRVRQLLRAGDLEGQHEGGDPSKPWRAYAWSVHAYRDATRGGARERREGTAAAGSGAPGQRAGRRGAATVGW